MKNGIWETFIYPLAIVSMIIFWTKSQNTWFVSEGLFVLFLGVGDQSDIFRMPNIVTSKYFNAKMTEYLKSGLSQKI